MMRTSPQRYVVPLPQNRHFFDITLIPELATSLQFAFHSLADLESLHRHREGEPSALEMLLLLSTCANHELTFNACAFEVKSWFRHERFNFDKALSALEATDLSSVFESVRRQSENVVAQTELELFRGGTKDKFEDSKRAARILDTFLAGARLSSHFLWSRTYLSEYRNKRKVFYEDFTSIAGAIEIEFREDESKEVFWEENFVKSHFVNSEKRPNIECRFRPLAHIEEMCWHLTDAVESSLVAAGLWFPGGPEAIGGGELPSPVNAMRAYDEEIKRARDAHFAVWCEHSFEELIAEVEQDQQLLSVSALVKAIKTARHCFEEIKNLFDLWVPVYEENSLTPFLPAEGKSVFSGFKEQKKPDQYILFTDMVRSKKSDTNIKRELQEILSKLGEDFRTETSGNDACLIVTGRWDNALAALKLMRTRTKDRIDEDENGFGGLRASISFGDVITRVSRHLGTILMDKEGEPVISIASYLNEQINKLLEEAGLSENLTECVVIDRKAVERVTGSIDDSDIRSNGFTPLGEWKKKGIMSTAYFLKDP